MTSNRKTTARGVSITLTVKAPNEQVAKEILEHPNLKTLVAMFEEKQGKGGQDVAKGPYAGRGSEAFLADARLRAKAVKWLLEQLKLPDGDAMKVVADRINEEKDLTIRHIEVNLPELATALNFVSDHCLSLGLGGSIPTPVANHIGYSRRIVPENELIKAVREIFGLRDQFFRQHQFDKRHSLELKERIEIKAALAIGIALIEAREFGNE